MADGHTTSATSFSTEALLNDNRPALRPGERLVAGEPYVFNTDLLNAHLADERIAAAPADLTGLTWEDLGTLHAAWLNADRRRDVADFGQRVCDERATRPEYAAFRGQAA